MLFEKADKLHINLLGLAAVASVWSGAKIDNKLWINFT